MYKTELIWAVADTTGMPKDASERAVGAMLESISEALSKGEDVVIPGFGTFTRRHRPARKGHNPKTGEAIDIPASIMPVFRPAKRLRDTVRNS